MTSDLDFYVMYALIVRLVGFLRVPEIRRFRLSVANFFGRVTLNMESLIDRQVKSVSPEFLDSGDTQRMTVARPEPRLIIVRKTSTGT
jgi:hypothetical protein